VKLILICAFLGLIFIWGCAQPQPEPKVIRKNRYYRCEPKALIQQKMLRLINQARNSRRKCGSRTYGAAAAVRWNQALADAAESQSDYMALNNRLSHAGFGGSTVEKRIQSNGYVWKSTGENVAGGLQTCEAVVAGWLDSPKHCANIMEPGFVEIGAACARNANTRYGTYWTLVLASPLK
jgi:uncharacterized protein YkwD